MQQNQPGKGEMARANRRLCAAGERADEEG